MALLETDLPGLPRRRGKVRDVYDLGDDRLLVVATDRISAFDWVLPTPIPDKGRVLTAISTFWFGMIAGGITRDHQAIVFTSEATGHEGKPTIRIDHHLLSTDIDDAGLDLSDLVREELRGRSMIVRKGVVIPFECVVRGYLSGSAWKEYRDRGTVCGGELPTGLRESDRIDPIFTPATKAETGHDENISIAEMARALEHGLPEDLMFNSLLIYEAAAAFARTRGLILADTKFEWGRVPDSPHPILIDEVLTPDSSRYWPAEAYEPGGPQPSFDKQYVRDWLESSGWDKQSPPPALPDEVVDRTREKYIDCYELLTGQVFPWT